MERSQRLVRVLLGGAVGATTCMAGGTAAAQPPLMLAGETHITYTLGECDGFHLSFEGIEQWRLTLFVDDEGLTGVLIHSDYDGTVANSVTGSSLNDDQHNNVVIDDIGEPTRTLTASGLAYGITVPGEGLIALIAGTITYDIDGQIVHQSTQALDLSADEIAALCDALA